MVEEPIRGRKYTLEEYFELERNSEERWEFWNGHIWRVGDELPFSEDELPTATVESSLD